MRILLLTHYFAPENSAPQRRWSALIERFVNAGHQVDVLCPPPHYPGGTVPDEHRAQYAPGTMRVSSEGARVLRVGYLPHNGGMLTRTLDHLWAALSTAIHARRLRHMRLLAPDVVIATAPAIETLFVGKHLAKLFGASFVVEMRDAWPDLVTHIHGNPRGGAALEKAKVAVHRLVTNWQRKASAVVTTTQRFADVLEARGIASPSVIRNGAPLERFRKLKQRIPGHTGLRVLYMGNMGRSQGLEYVVRTVGRMREAGFDIDVRFVGYGADKSRLRSINESLGSPVDIFDEVAASEVAEHYQWADSLLIALEPWQPFEWTVPSKLYEALATGRHVTAMLGGEAAEIVASVDAGDIVAPGDEQGLFELWAFLTAAPEALEINADGRHWVETHASYDALADKYLSLIDSVLAKPLKPREEAAYDTEADSESPRSSIEKWRIS